MLSTWLYRLIPQRPLKAWRPRLAIILLAVNLAIFVIPVAGVFLMRIYESSLLRQTESGLITQGVLIAASYESTAKRISVDEQDYIRLVKPVDTLSKTVLPQLKPRLDLATTPLEDPAPPPTPMAFDPPLLAYATGAVMLPMLQQSHIVTQSDIHLLDAAGQVVASTDYDIGLSLRHRQEVVEALSGSPTAVLRKRSDAQGLDASWLSWFSRSANLDVHVAVPILSDAGLLGAVVLSREPDTLVTALSGKRREILAGLGIMLAIVGLLSLFTSLTISQPVAALIKQSRRSERGEAGAIQPLPHPVTREIAELSQALSTMASSLEQRTDYIRSFAAQLSHELKSPLTSMRGAIELMQDHPEMGPERQAQFLDNLHGDVDRLTRLVSSILELARAEADKGGGRKAQDEDAASLSDAITDMMMTHPSIELYDPQDLAAGRLRVPLSQDDLYAVLKNLSENAFRHGASGLVIALSQSLTNEICVSVIDDGPGVSEANQAKLFAPFFTTDRQQGGTGLGLALVKALLEGVGGSIRYVPSGERDGQDGACFELRLPLVPKARGVLRL